VEVGRREVERQEVKGADVKSTGDEKHDGLTLTRNEIQKCLSLLCSVAAVLLLCCYAAVLLCCCSTGGWSNYVRGERREVGDGRREEGGGRGQEGSREAKGGTPPNTHTATATPVTP
jgi:hypothetical protein